MVSLVLLILGFGDVLAEVDATYLVDHLETPTHHLFLDSFEALVAVSKEDGTQTTLSLKGEGPQEILAPLSLLQTPSGPIVSGVYYTLSIGVLPDISVGNKSRLPIIGPVVYDDGRRRVFGTAASYWQRTDSGWQGYSGQELIGEQQRFMFPFENPVNMRHARAFAAIAMQQDVSLFGEPVNLNVHLKRGNQSMELPYGRECIQEYAGQLPKQFKNLMTFVNSWDRFAANSSWVFQDQRSVYAVVTLDTRECPEENISLVWVVDKQSWKVKERKTHRWVAGRPINAYLSNGRIEFILAIETNERVVIRKN